MARFTVRGMVLGVRNTPYSFEDDEGKTVEGESLNLVLFDEEATLTHDIKIKRSVAGKFTDLVTSQVVDVAVDVFANLRNGAPILSMSAVDVSPAR